MPRRHHALELDEVEHLLEHRLPLQSVRFWVQDVIELKWQVLVDFSQAFIREHVAVQQNNALVDFVSDG